MVDEAICVLRQGASKKWAMTACYRSGKKSVLDSLQFVAEEFGAASVIVGEPCVIIECNVERLVKITNPDEVYALAQWLVAASMQLATDEENA
jgi:hypothetical protein